MGTSSTNYLGLVYGVSIFLASAAGMGAAFLGNRIFPLKGGDQPPPPTPAEVAAAVKKAEKADTEASKLADKLAESVTEPEKEEVDAVTEPKKEEVEPVAEPEKEEVDAVTEPKKEEVDAVTEPKKEEVEPVAEPEKKEVEPVPELQTQPEPLNKKYIAKIEKELDVSPEIAEDIFTIINTPTAVVNTIPDIAGKFKAIKEALVEKHEDVAKLVASKILSFQRPTEISDDVFVKDLHELVSPPS
jgi:hypothetical protein